MHFGDYKTIISPQNSMNLFRGCTHGCIYCDSRSDCYRIQHAFEDIEVKRNAAEILESQLRRKRAPCMIATGSMCDPYIPLEEELRLTGQCVQVIEKHGFGLAILTKSAGVLRDLELFRAINEKAKCVVQMTLTTYDDELCKIIEPNVSVTSERFRALEVMRDAGIPTMVWLSPILPFINDTEENLRGILDYCVKAGVRGVVSFGFGVTLREGNREYFYSALDRYFPGMKQRYISQFGNAYVCNSPNNKELSAILKEICGKHGIIHDYKEAFAYMREFESGSRQISLF